MTLTGTAIGMTPEGVKRTLEEGYANGSPYQWALELWRNFHQAVARAGVPGHSPVQRFDMLNLHGGALKRVVWNTGPHMPEAELRDYMLTLGQGGGDTWALDNPQGDRHAGARESLLGWNPAGLVVLSYHPTLQPHGAMVWLFRNDQSLYDAALLPTAIEDALGNMEYDKVVPLGVDPFGFDWRSVLDQTATTSGRAGAGGLRRHGGVAFAMLGPDRTVDDLDGVDTSDWARRTGRAETPTALTNFLLDKVADVGATNVSVVYRVGSEAGRLDRTDSTGHRQGYDSRTIWGLEGWTTTSPPGGARRDPIAHETGTVPLSVASVEVGHVRWTLLDPGVSRNAFQPYLGLGHVAVRYRDELMFRPGRHSHMRQLAPWGIIEPSVAARVRLVVELDQTGPGWHIIQNPARSDVRAVDGGSIPWESFYDQWNELAPDLAAPIFDAMAAACAERPRNLEVERRLLAKLRRRIVRSTREPENVDVVTSDQSGERGSGDETSVGTGHLPDGRPTPEPPTPPAPGPEDSDTTARACEAEGSGTAGTVVRRRRPGLPTPEWVRGEQWVDDYAYDQDRFVVVERSGDDVIIRYNEDHDIFTSQVSWYSQWCAESRAGRIRRLPAAEIVDAVKDAYHLDSAPRYLYGMRDRRFRDILDKPRTDPSAPCVMTIGAGGFNNVDAVIESDLRSRADGVVAGGEEVA